MVKKQKKKDLYYILSIITVLVVFLIGGVLAFLTDMDSKTNVFIIGEVDIALIEPSWVPTIDSNDDNALDANKIRIGQSIPLDPKVQNLGDDDCYVYLKVYVPKGDYEVNNTVVEDGDLFSYEIDSAHWTELPNSSATNEDSNIYVYYYNEPLSAPNWEDSITEPLFTEITLEAKPANEKIKNVVIEAYAIQSTGLPEGTNVETTTWATEFIEYATEHPLNTSQVTPLSISVSDYGKYVDLGTHILNLQKTLADSKHPQADWRVFKGDSNGVWLILANDMPITSAPTDTGLNFSGSYSVTSNTRENLVTGLNSLNWKSLIAESGIADESGVIVKGAFTLPEWIESWNAYGEYCRLEAVETNGEYLISKDNAAAGGIVYVDATGYANTLYFPNHGDVNVNRYWLASYPVNGPIDLMSVDYTGFIQGFDCRDTRFGVRPCVYIPSSIALDTTGDVWTLKN